MCIADIGHIDNVCCLPYIVCLVHKPRRQQVRNNHAWDLAIVIASLRRLCTIRIYHGRKVTKQFS